MPSNTALLTYLRASRDITSETIRSKIRNYDTCGTNVQFCCTALASPFHSHMLLVTFVEFLANGALTRHSELGKTSKRRIKSVRMEKSQPVAEDTPP
jgi:hypothetical protein